MIFSDKGFEKEIGAVKKQGSFGDELSNDSKQSVRSKIMQAILAPELKTEPVFSWREKYHTAIRYAVSLVVGISLVSGTTFASNGTVPGDPLYSIKRVKEKIQLSLALSDASKTGLETKFAEDRLNELHALVAKFVKQDGSHNSDSNSGSPTTTAAGTATSTEDSNQSNGNQLEIKAQADASSQVKTAITKLKHLQAKFTASGQTEAATAIQINIVDLQNRAFLENIKIDDENSTTTSGNVKGESDDRRPNKGKGKGNGLQINNSTSTPLLKIDIKHDVDSDDHDNSGE